MSEQVTTLRRAAIIPSFNEERTIEAVVLAAQDHVDCVIVVDDGSIDKTSEIARQAGATVVRHTQNRGKACAIMTGFDLSKSRGFDLVVLLDGDGQHDPHEIPRLFQPLLSGVADVVVGSRFLDIKSPVPFYRTVGQRVLNVATHLGSGVRCSDSQCGFRAFNRRAFTCMRLNETFLHGLSAESEMQFEICAHGLRLGEVAVYVRYDDKPRRSPMRHGVSVLYRVAAMAAQRRQRRELAEQLEPVGGVPEVTHVVATD